MQRNSAVLSIAGFDPSAGAGVLADIKTFEAIGVYGCGICTGITWQNDVHFEGLRWLPFEEIEKQFHILAERFHFTHIKIGIIENLDVLNKTIQLIRNHHQEAFILWDPVIRSSTGFSFHNDFNENAFYEVLNHIDLITPNTQEAIVLGHEKDAAASAEKLSRHCSVFLKGGHSDEIEATDRLYSKEEVIAYPAERIPNAEKHGSGCVLSAAVTAFLALGDSLDESCLLAKNYVNRFLQSTDTLLGKHQEFYAPPI